MSERPPAQEACLADTPQSRREALAWQAHLEDLLIKSGGVTGGR